MTINIVKASRNNDSGRPRLEIELDISNLTSSRHIMFEMSFVQYKCLQYNTEYREEIPNDIIDQLVKLINH